jgi:hypothetical protein
MILAKMVASVEKVLSFFAPIERVRSSAVPELLDVVGVKAPPRGFQTLATPVRE